MNSFSKFIYNIMQSLMISENSNNSLLCDLLNASDSYLIERNEANDIIENVKKVV